MAVLEVVGGFAADSTVAMYVLTMPTDTSPGEGSAYAEGVL